MLMDSLITIANHIGLRLFSNEKGDRFILVDDEGNSSPIFKNEDEIAAYLSDYIEENAECIIMSIASYLMRSTSQ